MIELRAVDTSDSGPFIRFPKHMTPPASPPVGPIKPESETESDSNEKESPLQKKSKNFLAHEKFNLVRVMKNLRQFFKSKS